MAASVNGVCTVFGDKSFIVTMYMHWCTDRKKKDECVLSCGSPDFIWLCAEREETLRCVLKRKRRSENKRKGTRG